MKKTLIDLAKVTVYKKKFKKRTKKLSRIQKYAKALNDNLPNSEVWFQSKWTSDLKQEKISLYQDKFNEPVGKYIPDVINYGYKYIIEIDGSIHDDPVIKWKDSIKDLYFIKKGYQVFRIRAYDEDAYKQLVLNILEYRNKTIRRY